MRAYTTLPYAEYTVADGHFDTSRSPITTIVLHSSASTKQGLIDTFGGGSRMVSAHYAVDNDGSLLAFLEEYYTAYHSGNYDMNQKSIGIEHIDNGATVKLHTDAQYETSIKLVADICHYHNIPADSVHIIPHSQVTPTACPNGLDVNRIISGAQAILNQSPPQPLPPELSQYVVNWQAIAIQKGLDVNSPLFASYRAIDELIVQRITEANAPLLREVEQKNAVIDNLNQQINDRNNQLTTLQGKISTLESQVTELTTQRDMALEQAKQIPALKEQVEYLEGLKASWVTKEQNYLSQIETLKTKLSQLKKPLKSQLADIFIAITNLKK